MTTLHDEDKIEEIVSRHYKNHTEDTNIFDVGIVMKEYAEYIREKTIDEAIKIVHEIDFGGVTRGKADIIQKVKYKTITNLTKLKN